MPTPLNHPFLNTGPRTRPDSGRLRWAPASTATTPKDADGGYASNGKSLLNLCDAIAYTHPEWIRENSIAGSSRGGCERRRDEHVQRLSRRSRRIWDGRQARVRSNRFERAAGEGGRTAEFRHASAPAVRRWLDRGRYEDALDPEPIDLRRFRHRCRLVPPTNHPRSSKKAWTRS